MGTSDKALLAAFVKQIAYGRADETNELIVESQTPKRNKKREKKTEQSWLFNPWTIDRFVATRVVVIPSGIFHMYADKTPADRWELSWTNPKGEKYVLPVKFFTLENAVRVGNIIGNSLLPEVAEDNPSETLI